MAHSIRLGKFFHVSERIFHSFVSDFVSLPFVDLWSGIFLSRSSKHIRPCLQRDRVTSVRGSDFGQDISVIKCRLF